MGQIIPVVNTACVCIYKHTHIYIKFRTADCIGNTILKVIYADIFVMQYLKFPV